MIILSINGRKAVWDGRNWTVDAEHDRYVNRLNMLTQKYLDGLGPFLGYYADPFEHLAVWLQKEDDAIKDVELIGKEDRLKGHKTNFQGHDIVY